MSRLGDLIRTERIRQKLTPKQVAKKCGVSEIYILAVEAGTRIIADDQARRILKSIGLKQQNEADFTLDDIAATVDLAQVQPSLAQAAARPKPKAEDAVKVASTEEEKGEGVTGSVWLDALTSVLKNVPVIIMTNTRDFTVLSEIKRSAAAGYIGKPNISEDDLAVIESRLLRRR